MKRTNMNFGAVGGLFAVCILTVCLFITINLGSSFYGELNQTSDSRYAARTAAILLMTRLRSANAKEILEVGTVEGYSALLLRESGIEKENLEEQTITYIYCYDGAIRELQTVEGEQPSAIEGEELAAAESVNFILDGVLLRVECSVGGRDTVQYLKLTK